MKPPLKVADAKVRDCKCVVEARPQAATLLCAGSWAHRRVARAPKSMLLAVLALRYAMCAPSVEIDVESSPSLLNSLLLRGLEVASMHGMPLPTLAPLPPRPPRSASAGAWSMMTPLLASVAKVFGATVQSKNARNVACSKAVVPTSDSAPSLRRQAQLPNLACGANFACFFAVGGNCGDVGGNSLSILGFGAIPGFIFPLGCRE